MSACGSTTEVITTKTECAGIIVTWDKETDTLSNETKRAILTNNQAVEACNKEKPQ